MSSRKRQKDVSGHTAEILSLVSGLAGRPEPSFARDTNRGKNRYSPREYIVANTDTMSEDRIKTAEAKMGFNSQYFITKVPRSREVHQSWITTVMTTLYASLYCFPIVFKSRPDLLLCNGPGTCIPLCFAAFLLKLTGMKDVSIIYIESICRVESLSLSARILYYFADHILVQWPQLLKKFPGTEYIGRIV
ncbi:UDP-N-acetylglucosamine transferase subunit ALG14 homolog [Lingula anatina]|uniref:UDP-N-acetylglucosamine transferase subunit ALG14 n=1 Tax=Lingula anatina TaxID=7574 RepID=A0A2R2MPJ1_LINAN|nr:UDP-N-acetylglucosamine transferase subunit ALG14 homolog [Lingula anatina]|eukprot:XP_023932154.1 UDP-N-acetylglucosamine transferase subunit ALG14 homolog [Lingula anatina]